MYKCGSAPFCPLPRGPPGPPGERGPPGPNGETECDVSHDTIKSCSTDTVTILAELGVAASPTTPFVAVVKAVGEGDISLALTPLGNGALIADEPDGSADGGNPRGLNAVDLQMQRALATQVASGNLSVIGGGENNTASASRSVVSGGFSNTASAIASTVGGGASNTASGNSSTVGGGSVNGASGLSSTIGGGIGNEADGVFSTVGGGSSNEANADFATISGGGTNTASGDLSTVSGGLSNTASGELSAVGGGLGNTGSGDFSTIPGGFLNIASGDFSFAAGSQAEAVNDNSFVWNVPGGAATTTADNQVIFNLIPGAFAPPAIPNRFFINGGFDVSGFKNFLMHHPLLPNKYLRHSCIEGPNADLMYKGKVQLNKGTAQVDIDLATNMHSGTFSALAEDSQVYLTNNVNFDLVRTKDLSTVSSGKFEIISNNVDSSATIDWLVISRRKLPRNGDVEIDKPVIVPTTQLSLEEMRAQAKAQAKSLIDESTEKCKSLCENKQRG